MNLFHKLLLHQGRGLLTLGCQNWQGETGQIPNTPFGYIAFWLILRLVDFLEALSIVSYRLMGVDWRINNAKRTNVFLWKSDILLPEIVHERWSWQIDGDVVILCQIHKTLWERLLLVSPRHTFQILRLNLCRQALLGQSSYARTQYCKS